MTKNVSTVLGKADPNLFDIDISTIFDIALISRCLTPSLTNIDTALDFVRRVCIPVAAAGRAVLPGHESVNQLPLVSCSVSV